jgi:hypothetical protein
MQGKHMLVDTRDTSVRGYPNGEIERMSAKAAILLMT